MRELIQIILRESADNKKYEYTLKCAKAICGIKHLYDNILGVGIEDDETVMILYKDNTPIPGRLSSLFNIDMTFIYNEVRFYRDCKQVVCGPRDNITEQHTHQQTKDLAMIKKVMGTVSKAFLDAKFRNNGNVLFLIADTLRSPDDFYPLGYKLMKLLSLSYNVEYARSTGLYNYLN